MRNSVKRMKFVFSFILLGVMTPVWSETAAPAATPTAPTVTLGGLVDGYYSYNFTNSANTLNGSGNSGQNFNASDNSYTLGLAEVSVTATQGEGSAHLVLAYGQTADMVLGIDPSVTSPVVLQGYLSYAPGQWVFNFGKFVTWMGNELIESKSDWNYSRSLSFQYTIPYYHTGLSVGYTTTDGKLAATGYVVDGWNSPAALNVGQRKTFGLNVILKPESAWTIVLNGILGPNPASSVDGSARYDGEAIITWNATDKFSLALDAVYGGQDLGTTGTSDFYAFDLYGRYQMESDWALALRLEDLKDNQNMLGLYAYAAVPVAGATDVEGRDVTLTVEHNFNTNLLMRVEGRYDYALSGGNIYAAKTGPFAGGSADLLTGTVGMVFSF